jgi:hypothetical protein
MTPPRELLDTLRAVEAARRAVGLPPMTAEMLRKQLPGLAAFEAARAPGIVDLVVASAGGDENAAKRLVALVVPVPPRVN